MNLGMHWIYRAA